MRRHAVQGFYKEHFCRSLHEFHFALYLDLVEKVDFVMEPFAMISEVIGKKKIPDVMYFDLERNRAVIVEIKQTREEITDLVVDYATNKYRVPLNISEKIKSCGLRVDHEFYFNCKVALKKDIIDIVGEVEYKRLLSEYKSQRKTYTGFPGSLHPNFGKHLSSTTKSRQSLTIIANGGHAGSRNGNYGNHLSVTSKVAVGAKWHDLNTKNGILRTSLLNRLEILTDNQYDEFAKYSIKSLSGIKCKRPLFMNGTIKITNERVIELFGSYNNFWNFVRQEII